MMTTVLITLSLLCLIIGLIGCIVPSIPGPPVSYCALLLLHAASDVPLFSAATLITFFILTLSITVLEYAVPLMGARLYGASKYGMWGSIAGMLIGVIFFPPFGMIAGILLGAIIGELIGGYSSAKALRSGFFSFVATITVMVLKFSTSVLMTYVYIRAAVSALKI
jgi:uncharacterized protein